MRKRKKTDDETPEQRLDAAGVGRGEREVATGLGISLPTLLLMALKYGPLLLHVLEDLLAHKEGRLSDPPAEVTPV